MGRRGDRETRRRGDEETRKHGDTVTRRRGDTETRRRGDAEINLTTRHSLYSSEPCTQRNDWMSIMSRARRSR